MSDLIGPNPCEGCPLVPAIGSKRPKCADSNPCPAAAAYAARKDLLEALKAGGVKGWWYWNKATLSWDQHGKPKRGSSPCTCVPGHLIFIPEAQG